MVKSYAAMGGLHGAIDAARRLRNSVAPQDISSVDITVGETVYKHGWWLPERPLTPIGAQMNIGYATAAALLDGNVLPEQFTAARLDADDIWALISATRVHLDESLADADITEKLRTDLAVTTREEPCTAPGWRCRTARPTIRSPTTKWWRSSTRWPTGRPAAAAPRRSNAQWSDSTT